MTEIDRQQELETLFEQYLTCSITEAEGDRLIELCDAHPDRTDELLEHLVLNEILNDMRKYGNSRNERSPSAPRRRSGFGRFTLTLSRRSGRRILGTLVVTSLISLFVVSAVLLWNALSPTRSQAPEIVARTMLKKTQNAVWATPVENHSGVLDTNWVRLNEGLAQIDIAGGAQVVLDGLTEFRAVADNRVVCTRGRMTVYVPPRAVGFRVDLPQISIIDLGTEFTIEAGESESFVHVLQGKVTLVDPASNGTMSQDKGLLLSGESARIGAAGVIERLSLKKTSEISPNSSPGTRFLTENRCRVIAHRGAAEYAPECTIPAIEKAIELRADGCSLPVYATKDGELVVVAEPLLKRTTGSNGRVDRLTLTELKRLDAGRWKGDAFIGTRIPTLEEALETLSGSGCTAYVELMVPGFESQVTELLRKTSMIEQTVVVSSNPETLRRIREIEPELISCWRHTQKQRGSMTRNAAYFAREARRIGTDRIVMEPVSSELLRELIETKGLEIGCWTVNDETTAKRLLEVGVSGIATDRFQSTNNVIKQELLSKGGFP